MIPKNSQIHGLLFGIAVGDALGVPVEFMSRAHLENQPVTGFDCAHFNSENKGIWSDDTSLTLCLTESLIEGYTPAKLAEKIQKWCFQNYWAPFPGHIQEIGIATRQAIDRLEKGIKPNESGETGEYSNGNGALMRVAPLAFTLLNESIEERYQTVKTCASITHAHIRNTVACFFYIEFLRCLIYGKEKFEAFEEAQNTVRDYINSTSCNNEEKALFLRLFYDEIYKLEADDIYSSAYVIHTLEAAIWAFLTTNSYQEAVLKVINLGHDTDTTGSVTGAMAGIYYGYQNIPSTWIATIARTYDIKIVADKFEKYLINS